MKQVKKFFVYKRKLSLALLFVFKKFIDKNALKLSSVAYLEIYIDKKWGGD